jgi:phosphatidylglycerophosphatase A
VNAFILWLAQGFGIGRIPKAPGTFGSVLGLAWFAALLMTGNLGLYLIGCAVGLALSVWLCGAGEKILKARDPGSIVFDEIAAIPICFAGWIFAHLFGYKVSSFPSPAFFFSKQHVLATLGVVAAFRLFDVWKPWPVRQSQSLPGGWGVTVDDALAALYVNIVVLTVWYCSVALKLF